MEGQAFFTTIAGLGVSLAGFGSVIAWLRDDPSGWDPVNLWRVKTIVRHGLTLAFFCLLLQPLYTFTNSSEATIRLASVVIALYAVSDVIRFWSPDPEIWEPRSSWIVFMAMSGVITVAMLANSAWASLGLLQIIVLVLLSSPAGIFSNFVREMGGRPGSARAEPGD